MGEQSINKGSSVAMFLIPRRQWWAFDQPEWDAGAQQANRFPLLFIKTLLDAVPTCTCGRGLNLRDLKCYFFLFSVLNLHVCADVPLAKTSRFSYHEANIHLWKTMDFVGLLMSCVCLPWVYFYLHAHAGAPGRKGWTRLRGKKHGWQKSTIFIHFLVSNSYGLLPFTSYEYLWPHLSHA